MGIRVTSTLGDLAADLRTIAVEAKPTMARVVAKNARQGRNLARDFARVSAGKHGKHYPNAITDEQETPLRWVYGPDEALPQGGMSFEYGSRNQKPHLDLNRSADIVGPALAFEVGKAVDDLFLARRLMATEEEHAEAVIAALNAAISTFNPALTARAFDYDDIPSPRPANYVEVTLSRRYGGVQRSSGERDGQLYRITTRVVGKFVKNARDLRSAAYGIEGASLTVAGQTTTPVEFETAQPIAPDEGWYSGLTSWTYALI